MAAGYVADNADMEPAGRGVDDVDESSKSWWYLFILTLSIGG